MKRVLIITYYWPPSGGSGVQRWLKFAKYLPGNDWQPVIYTPENPDFNIQDASLLKDIPESVEVVKQPIWEPYKYAQLFSRDKKANTGTSQKKTTKKETLSSKIPKWIRGNIFLPDPRVYWVKPSVRYLKQYLKESPVDIIISTGPPHSMHLIAQELKQQTNLPWIADFRDPFSKMDVYDTYYMRDSSRRKNEAMEKAILTNCDLLLATSYSLPELLVDFDATKMRTITNGYDSADYNSQQEKHSDKYLIFHAGTLNNVRDPSSLWKVLVKWSKERPKLYEQIEIKLAGSVSADIKNEVQQNDLLRDKVHFLGYLSHDAIFKLYQEASLDPASDAAEIIRATNAGFCVEYTDVERTESSLLELMTHQEQFKITKESIEQYSRANLTKELVELLNVLVDKVSLNG